VTVTATVPFDAAKLDSLMDAGRVDVLLASSKHNVRYLLGGHHAVFFRHFDALGTSRFQPIVGYVKGRPEVAFYIGSPLEADEVSVAPIWPGNVQLNQFSSEGAAHAAADLISKIAGSQVNVAIEFAFLPADSVGVLNRALPHGAFTDAHGILEELRAVKSPKELDFLRKASRGVVDAMLAAFAITAVGATDMDLVETYKREVLARGLTYEYALVTIGRDLNRAVSNRRWERGQLLSLDSGAEYAGYIGDFTRMAVQGDPSPRMVEVLEQVQAVQAAARAAIRAGEIGTTIYESATTEMARLPDRAFAGFLAHGMGLISHEAPRLTATGGVPYPATHARRPLETGMVISIESQILDPSVGFVKLEDTLFVTATGCEGPADQGTAWNLAGGSSASEPRQEAVKLP
jgi:Xaa-Pro aminopeptidase